MKLFYEMTYRYLRAPWDTGAREELVSLVKSGRIQPARAIDLGCGTGANTVYLAQQVFDMTGVDYAPAAIEKAQARAREAGVQVNFFVDDLTNLRLASGTFDFLLDYGVLDDLRPRQRELYLRNMLPLTRSGSQYLLWGFEYSIRGGKSSSRSLTFPSIQGRSRDALVRISKSKRLRARSIIQNGRRVMRPIS